MRVIIKLPIPMGVAYVPGRGHAGNYCLKIDMEKQLKSLLVASQKILRTSKGKNPQHCVDLLQQMEVSGLKDRNNPFVVLL